MDPSVIGPACGRVVLCAILCLGTGGSAQASQRQNQAETAPQAIERALHMEDFARAESLAAAHLKSLPGDAKVRILLARAQMARNDYQSAFKNLRKALAADPGNLDALYYLGRVSLALSQSEYERLFSLAPESHRVHQTLGDSYQAQEQLAEAEQEYLSALKANPRSVEVLVSLGDLKRSQSAFEEALEYYSGALEIEPRNYDAVYGTGVCYSYRQDHEGAMDHYSRALAIDPNSAPARLALGYSLVRTGRLEEAIPELKGAASLEPRMRQAFYLLGQCYQRLGRAEEAKAAFSKVEELMKSEVESAQRARASDDLIRIPSSEPDPGSGSAGQERKKPRQ